MDLWNTLSNYRTFDGILELSIELYVDIPVIFFKIKFLAHAYTTLLTSMIFILYNMIWA